MLLVSCQLYAIILNREFKMESDNRFVEEIVQLQRRHGYTDQKMAELIGCSRTLYQRTRTGKMQVSGKFLRGAMKLLSSSVKEGRASVIKRETRETNIIVEINVDGSGQYEINTGIGIFDHMLSQVARHGIFDIKVTATGDDQHHIVEDVAICLGKAFGEALGDKRGIVRMADVMVPMDDSLAMVAVDIGGRGYTVLDISLTGNDMSGFASDLIRHFLESFASEARLNLHARVIYGSNDHHKAEALFKALGRALDKATRIDERIRRELPSTKGFLEA
jgi:imidazoleglycerol-phosphate dehydratase